MYKRLIQTKIEGNRRNILLLVPRQVGKSTLLSSLKPDLTINLASPTTFRDYISHPEQLELELKASKSALRTVFIIEMKSSRQVSRSALRGLTSFAERTKRIKRKIVVFLGPRKQQIEDIEIIPLRQFLQELP